MGERILGVGDRIESRPCQVTIRSVEGSIAYGWCGPCQALHIIDAERFDSGQGPWRTAAAASGPKEDDRG